MQVCWWGCRRSQSWHHLAMDQIFPHCLTLASCCFWVPAAFPLHCRSFSISRQLLTTSVHALCYFTCSYTPLVVLLALFYSCAPSFFDLPTPLHAPSFLALPSSARQVFLGSKSHTRTLIGTTPSTVCPLLLGLARSFSLRFSFPTQWCAQPPNPQCAVVKISPTSELSLFHPNWWGEPVITAMKNLISLSMRKCKLVQAFKSWWCWLYHLIWGWQLLQHGGLLIELQIDAGVVNRNADQELGQESTTAGQASLMTTKVKSSKCSHYQNHNLPIELTAGRTWTK